MRTCWKWLLVLAILAIPATCLAAAQPGQKTGKGKRLIAEGEVIELLLLRQKAVRDDLKLDKEFKTKVFEFTGKQHEKAEEVRKLPEAEQKAKWEDMAKENDAFLKDNLNPDQRKRLKQIAIQVVGLLWVTRKRIADELKLTDDQKTKARMLQKEARKDLMDLADVTNPKDRKEKVAALKKHNRERLMGLLTAEQKTKLQELAGAPFRGELIFEEEEKGSKEQKEEAKQSSRSESRLEGAWERSPVILATSHQMRRGLEG
jgi:hypothetical protein